MNIPLLSDDANEETEYFMIHLYIPSATYELGIQQGSIVNAIASILSSGTNHCVKIWPVYHYLISLYVVDILEIYVCVIVMYIFVHIDVSPTYVQITTETEIIMSTTHTVATVLVLYCTCG